MKLLVRPKDAKHWAIAELDRPEAEAVLQTLIIESPLILPIDEIREGASPLVVAVGEFGLPGSGSTDVLAFSATGDIVIVECKLAANTESKRKVIGQILEYAAFLWGMTYADVAERVARLRGKDLEALVEEAVAGEWERSAFESGMAQTLVTGAFILIIVVDEINEELRRIVRYVNECGNASYSLHALEVQRFRAGDVDVLVPHLFGTASGPTPPAPKRRWTEERYFEVLGERADARVAQVVRTIYDWTATTADRTWFGTGQEMGSFTFHFLRAGKTVSVFTMYTSGTMVLNYGYLAPVLGAEAMEQLHRKLIEIPTFSKIPADFTKFPNLPIAKYFPGESEVLAFKLAVESLRERAGKGQ